MYSTGLCQKQVKGLIATVLMLVRLKTLIAFIDKSLVPLEKH